MPWPYDMVGHQIDYHQNVPVVPLFQLNIRCPVPKVASHSLIRHNEIRDLTATLLTEVCNDVCTEPELQPVTDEELIGATANSQAGARLDSAANGVWGVLSRENTLISEYSIPMLHQIGTPICNQFTESMNR